MQVNRQLGLEGGKEGLIRLHYRLHPTSPVTDVGCLQHRVYRRMAEGGVVLRMEAIGTAALFWPFDLILIAYLVSIWHGYSQKYEHSRLSTL